MALEHGLAGKVALVTGGGTGLGHAIADALAAEGVHVAIVGRRNHRGTASALATHGVRAVAFQANLAEEATAATLVDRTISELGGLDLLVCSAAVAVHEPIAEATTAAWERTLLTNVLSSMWVCRSALQHMRRTGTGSILIIGSTAQFHRAYGQAAYHVSKAALAAFATSLAIEAAPTIRVNLIVPGRFPTGLNPSAARAGTSDIPMGRPGVLAEIGPAAVFLLSNRLASYITGAELVVSGGLHLRPMGHRGRTPLTTGPR